MSLLDKAEFRKMSNEQFPLSNNQAKQFLSKHKLGDLISQTFIGGNFTNSVFECQTTSNTSFMLKIQYRTGSLPLEADRDVTLLLKDTLPVSSTCILDNNGDIIPHPTLVLSKLGGELAQTIFENSTHETRIQLSRILGKILATIHSASISPSQVPIKPQFSLNGWREMVENGLFNDEALQRELERFDPKFYPQLQRLLNQVPEVHVDEKFCLLWGDPKFHNFLVQVDGNNISLSGVFDFQTAGWGNPLFDALYLEGNFGRTQANGLYQNAEYSKSCNDAYAELGMELPKISETERALRDVILKANGPRWWWESAKILPPFTQNTLAGLLDSLEWLKTNAA